MEKNMNLKLNTKHPFHLVNASPWPFFIAFTVLNLALSLVWFFHYYQNGGKLLLNSILLTAIIMIAWWRDVIIEGTFEGQHTQAVQKGLRIGVALFILSEAMFFFGFFWAFFHSSLSPAIQIGGIWPPKGITPMSYLGIPFLNTIILLTSGVTVTWFHYLITSTILHSNFNNEINIKNEGILSLGLTVLLGLIFLGFQGYEYIHATFTLSDGVYGSTFYLLTGFHGFHVIVGTLFLLVCLIRYINNHFTERHHIGLEAAIWYWHFVDVVWLFLYISIYWWGDIR
jgi:cytochrome c oxidase subunit 3